MAKEQKKSEQPEPVEICVGCGDAAPEQPMVGVTFEDGEAVAHPICAACHQDPSRAGRPLKVHFFPRAQKKVALALAGSSNLGGR